MAGSHGHVAPSEPQPGKGEWAQTSEWMTPRLAPPVMEPVSSPGPSKKRNVEEINDQKDLVPPADQGDHNLQVDDAGEALIRDNENPKPEPEPEVEPTLEVPELTSVEQTQFLQERYDLVSHWADDHV